jgi:zinc D-Ala-D-Ala carboxypeptidase
VIEDWSKYPNFNKSEFDCSKTGKNFMQPEFMDRLQAMRTEAKFPFQITSGYRDITHPVEAAKPKPGQHNHGLAADIACTPDTAYKLIKLALKHGFTGIGVSQKQGIPRFVHIDLRDSLPVVYSY